VSGRKDEGPLEADLDAFCGGSFYQDSELYFTAISCVAPDKALTLAGYVAKTCHGAQRAGKTPSGSAYTSTQNKVVMNVTTHCYLLEEERFSGKCSLNGVEAKTTANSCT
jgi:hypothetical protein